MERESNLERATLSAGVVVGEGVLPGTSAPDSFQSGGLREVLPFPMVGHPASLAEERTRGGNDERCILGTAFLA